MALSCDRYCVINTFGRHNNLRHLWPENIMMRVFKFGGASVNSIERIQNLAGILASLNEPLLIVISAMGKTTNALEKVVEAFYQQQPEQALALFAQVKNQHLTTAKYLLVQNYLACEAQLRDFFTEVEWLLHDKPVREFDYYYDQVVCCGELLSTAIVSSKESSPTATCASKKR